MFDFEKLHVYSRTKEYNKKVTDLISISNYNRTTKDQLRRASLSILLNIAEGSGRFTNPDRRKFYIISRGSIFECIAIFDYLHYINQLDKVQFDLFYKELEEISKMLYTMIKRLS
ncbi:four helix bundle protein [Lishizhenia tianjinensis]|uniref:Four helix bundle protein n=1 Tax=Lishizhenia tianjinensis TaxID=477690 RepID=A0A1I6ZPE9_9FLAO|nr:four helix bundle protein [Lishizhenia tianjinensis]SFT64589.1 four helix bundle protein [Lishizhenia tianjinensis]